MIQIWISPVTEQVPNDTSVGEAYHGYWPNNMNEMNNNFGDTTDLKALSKALHDRDMVSDFLVSLCHD
jgi:alpha-amylase